METVGSEPTPRGAAQGHDSGGEMKEKASQLAHGVREKAMDQIDQRKDQLVGVMDRVADAVEDDGVGGVAARYVRRGAGALRDRPAAELLSRASAEMRARPGATLAACLLAGFALARMARD